MEKKILTASFNKHAPDYEPELWKDKVSNKQLIDFMRKHSDSIGKLISQEGSLKSIPQISQNQPPLATQLIIGFVLKEVEKSEKNGEGLSAIAQRYDIKESQLKRLADDAKQIYVDQGFQRFSNCYAYAMNDPDRHSAGGASPGQRGAGVSGSQNYVSLMNEALSEKDFSKYKQHLFKAIEADGAMVAGIDKSENLEGYYRVAVYLKLPDKETGKGKVDYHFVREDKNGWSHMTSSDGEVTNKDFEGNVIKDPKTAKMGAYEIVGFIYVPAGGLDVGLPSEPKTKPGSVDVDQKNSTENRFGNPYPELRR